MCTATVHPRRMSAYVFFYRPENFVDFANLFLVLEKDSSVEVGNHGVLGFADELILTWMRERAEFYASDSGVNATDAFACLPTTLSGGPSGSRLNLPPPPPPRPRKPPPPRPRPPPPPRESPRPYRGEQHRNGQRRLRSIPPRNGPMCNTVFNTDECSEGKSSNMGEKLWSIFKCRPTKRSIG